MQPQSKLRPTAWQPENGDAHAFTVSTDPPPTSGEPQPGPHTRPCPFPGGPEHVAHLDSLSLSRVAVTYAGLWATGLPAKEGQLLRPEQHVRQSGEHDMQTSSVSSSFGERFRNASFCSPNKKVILPEPENTPNT